MKSVRKALSSIHRFLFRTNLVSKGHRQMIGALLFVAGALMAAGMIPYQSFATPTTGIQTLGYAAHMAAIYLVCLMGAMIAFQHPSGKVLLEAGIARIEEQKSDRMEDRDLDFKFLPFGRLPLKNKILYCFFLLGGMTFVVAGVADTLGKVPTLKVSTAIGTTIAVSHLVTGPMTILFGLLALFGMYLLKYHSVSMFDESVKELLEKFGTGGRSGGSW